MTGYELFGAMIDQLISQVAKVQDRECPNCAGEGQVCRNSSTTEMAECDECKGTGHDTRRDA